MRRSQVDPKEVYNGCVFTLAGGSICWKSSVQSIVAMSTTEAKYMVVDEATKEALWLTELVKELGVEQRGVQLHCDTTFGVGAVQVLATILTLWLADKSGRRLLLIVSSSAMALSLLVVSISFYLKEYISPDSDLYATLSLVSVAGVVVMVIAFSLGLGAMPWIIMSEILPINIKGLAGSFATLSNWFFSWLVTLTANLLLDWSSGGTFTIYTAVCVFTAGFVAIWVPETKGKTLEEIQQEWLLYISIRVAVVSVHDISNSKRII
ncbi:sugar transporter ERD6-like 6 [Lathyrus oleraceus]|uniref:sugar transporter ERD6-like 6 n=1 Tax=Pisum sativum TaxID=3888 RepID=UPI0021D217B5|nr:sugar transporter ERD6-like 6 [Pisum sativum]